MSSLTGSLIAWYQAYDNTDSTGSYDLILQNNASTSSVGDNKCGSYFTFPQEGAGPVSYLDVSTIGRIQPNSDVGFTFSTWVYNITPSPDTVWILSGDGFHTPFYLDNGGVIKFNQDCFGGKSWSSGYDLRSAMAPGTWHHLAMTISGSSVGAVTPSATYYLNGGPVAAITLDAGCNPFSYPGANGIGYINNESSGGGYLKAFERMTDIAFWDRVLSPSEITQLSTDCLSNLLAPPVPTNIRNLFGTFVHDVPEGTSPIELRQYFGTLVHTIASIPEISGKMNLYSNIAEVAWIYKDDSPGGGGGSGGPPPLKPLGNGGPMISSDYTINSFKALSAERVRRVDQVPFRLARKDRLGVRKLVITGSTPPEPPTGDDIRIYENIAEIAWIYKE